MIINEQVEAKLEELGICLDCILPLEISDDASEARATGYMAEVIIRCAMDGDFDDD